MSVLAHLDDGRTHLSLQAAGGMIGPLNVHFAGRAPIEVLTCPDWADQDRDQEWLPLISNLCGDFVCVPYGAPSANDALPAEWLAGIGAQEALDPMFHGTPVNTDWLLVETGKAGATMAVDLPKPLPLSRIERHVRLLPGQAGYACDLTLMPRQDVAMPISLHPCFRLPEAPEQMHISFAASGPGWTYPVPPVEETALVAANARFDDLASIPARDGGTLDFTHLPPQQRTETLLQVPLATGKVTLTYPGDGYRVTFSWDVQHLPSLVLWISNQGRDEAPFSGQFRTLGIEAVAGAFDLGPSISCSPDNPVAREGIPTTVKLDAGKPLTITSSIVVEAI